MNRADDTALPTGSGRRMAHRQPMSALRRRLRRQLLGVCIAACAAATAARAAAPETSNPSTAQPPAAASTAVPRLFTPSINYNGTAFANLDGGLRRGSTYSGVLGLGLYFDGNAVPGWAGTLAYVNAVWLHGGQPSELVGDAQGVSNISAPRATRVYEAWMQKNALGNRVSALAGLYDLNSEFYNLQTASLFLNGSFGIGPAFSQSGFSGPSLFPRTGFAARLAVRPGPNSVLRLAVSNGRPFERADGSHALHRSGDGALLMAEFALTDRPDDEDRPRQRSRRIGRQISPGLYDGKLAVGGWYYTARFDDLVDLAPDGTPLRRRGSGGAYAAGQVLLHRSAADPSRRLSGFAQLGAGDGRTNRFGGYLGAGLVATGWLRPGTDDELGLAVAVARNGSHYLAAQRLQGLPAARTETTIEASYLIPVNANFAIQPDLQYVIHPNTDPLLANSLSFQLRFAISY